MPCIHGSSPNRASSAPHRLAIARLSVLPDQAAHSPSAYIRVLVLLHRRPNRSSRVCPVLRALAAWASQDYSFCQGKREAPPAQDLPTLAALTAIGLPREDAASVFQDQPS